MKANLIFKWLRDERYALEPDAAAEEAEPIFLPVEVEAANSPVTALAPVPAGRIEIELPGSTKYWRFPNCHYRATWRICRR
jgi:transposase